MIEKNITIANRQYRICGDEDYLGAMAGQFEPDTCALLATLCDGDSIALDVGANLGLTALALSRIAQQGRVLAFEPVAAAYALLARNIINNATSQQTNNIDAFNIALGNSNGFANMFVNDRNYATSFVVNTSTEQKAGQVPLQRLDDFVTQQGITRVDFIKIDVEGFELDVLAGASALLARDKPTVLLEMNHWCLNVFRRISIPEFHERLLAIFPVVFAVHENDVVDFRDADNSGRIFHAHIIGNRYMHIVAGFDRDDIKRRLAALPAPAHGSGNNTTVTPIAAAPFGQRLKRSLRILLAKET